jgi:hypothetical protein
MGKTSARSRRLLAPVVLGSWSGPPPLVDLIEGGYVHVSWNGQTAVFPLNRITIVRDNNPRSHGIISPTFVLDLPSTIETI